MDPSYTFVAKIWQYPGKDLWYFITIPKKYAQEIRALTSHLPNKGFGTVRVQATVNGQRWSTSIFPDKKSESYLMPLKKGIRTKLQIVGDETIEISVRLINL